MKFKVLGRKIVAIMAMISMVFQFTLIGPVMAAESETIIPPVSIDEPVVTPTAEPLIIDEPTPTPTPTPTSTVEVPIIIEPTPTPISTVEVPIVVDPIIEPTPTPTPTEIIPEPILTPIEPVAIEPEIILPTWVIDGNSATTGDLVKLNETYVAPQNNHVKVKFTKLPETAGYLTIKEIKLSPNEQKISGSASSTVYDITSSMIDGTFEYDLTLPLPTSLADKNIVVKSSENISGLKNAEIVTETISQKVDTITIKGLNHFTIFVVATLSDSVCISAGSTCFQTIQEAIDAAISGDTIIVSAGTYTENINVNKSLTIKGVGDTTVVNGSIEATGDSVNIEDLMVANSNPHGAYDYGVKAIAGKALTLENVTVDVLHNGVYMRSVSMSATTININNSNIKGFDAVYLLDPAYSTDDTNGAVGVNISNTSLTGTTSYSGLYDDMAVITVDYVDNVHVDFTGSSSVANEYTNGAQSKERLIWFYYAGNSSVTGTPTYTNAANSQVNTDALFVSSLDYTNTVEGQTVGRYVDDSTQFEVALASVSTTPIMFGTDIVTTKDNVLNAEVKLIIEHNYSVTISTETTLTNNGSIIIEHGASLINDGTIAIIVTANDQSKERGTSDPALTYTGASSLVNGDTFTGSLIRTAGEAIGVYPITLGTLSAGTHYAITYVGANLTISDTIAPTIPSYTVSETIISPNGDGTKDSSSIDVAYSEQVNADINILDNHGVNVKDLYNSAAVTDPVARSWNGKNNASVVVADGVYTIQVIGTDSAGLFITDISKTITVDNTASVITIEGQSSSPLIISQGATYTTPNASAWDNVDGNLGQVEGSWIDTEQLGETAFNYSITDSAGNIGTASRAVTIVAVGPTLSNIAFTQKVAGGLLVPVVKDSNGYYLQTTGSATAPDHIVQFTTDSVSDKQFSLAEPIVGLYLLPTDEAQTTALQAYYSANSVEPYLTYLNAAAAGTEPFVYVRVNPTNDVRLVDGAQYAIHNWLNDMVIPDDCPNGEYTVQGTAADRYGNTTVLTFILIVDHTAPVITIAGDSTVNIDKDLIYTDAGATASDNIDGDITTSIVTINSVDTALVGTYSVAYDVKDAAGNMALTKIRTVNVILADNQTTISSSGKKSHHLLALENTVAAQANSSIGSLVSTNLQNLSSLRSNSTDQVEAPATGDAITVTEPTKNDEVVNPEVQKDILGAEQDNTQKSKNNNLIWYILGGLIVIGAGLYIWRTNRKTE